jgi:hypothetical protein
MLTASSAAWPSVYVNVPRVSLQRLLSLLTRTGTGPATWEGVAAPRERRTPKNADNESILQMRVPAPWKTGITSVLSKRTRSAGLSTKLFPILRRISKLPRKQGRNGMGIECKEQRDYYHGHASTTRGAARNWNNIHYDGNERSSRCRLQLSGVRKYADGIRLDNSKHFILLAFVPARSKK